MHCKLLRICWGFRSIFLAAALGLSTCLAFAQGLVVTGKVISSEDNQGLPGTNVLIKGTATGTVTDATGSYRIEVPSPDAVLVFSSIGYSTLEVTVGGRTTVDVSLQLDVTQLSEVVVVGYGTVKKTDVTGALSSVSADQLTAVPVQSISQALQGRAAGVDIAQTSFRPGDNPTIRIRGNRSLIGGNDPLIVMDGIPLPEGSGINDFNPADIESVQILKDASSTAIYGSRGANGVILVTTKKGKSGKVKIGYEGFYGSSKPLTEIEMMSGGQFAEMKREAYRNNTGLTYFLPWADVTADYALFSPQDIELWNSVADGYTWVDKENRIPQTRPVTAEERQAFEAYYDQFLRRYPGATGEVAQNLTDLRALLDNPNLEIPVYDPGKVRNTDWGDLALQTGKKQSHQFSVAGGSDDVKVYFGGGYYDEKGIQKTQEYTRYNLKLSIDAKLSEGVKVGGTINGMFSEQAYGSPLYFRAIGQIPLAIPYDANGNVILQPGGDALIFSPLNEIDDYLDDRRVSRYFGSYYADIKIVDGLRYHINVGTDFKSYRRGRYQGALTSDRRGGTSWAEYYQDQRVSYVVENLLYYDKTINEVHTIGATALYSLQREQFESSFVNISNLPYESQKYYNLKSSNAAGPDDFGSDYQQKTFISWMGRVNYSYRDRYLLTATGRYDGLSPLAEGNKWGFFPSASVAWKIHNEGFMSNLSLFDELKLRLGFGEVGNAGVPPYIVPGRLQKTPYVYAETAAWGYGPLYPPNPNLKWEGTKSLNLGLDFSLFAGRVGGTIEAYKQTTDNLLTWRSLPTVSGYSSIMENIGNVQNKGIELALNTINVETDNGFRWTTDFIYSKNKEEITELYGGTNDDVLNRWFIGQPITTYFDWQPIGIWQVDEAEAASDYGRIPGQAKIKDIDNNGVINANDRVIRGNNVPDWTGSMVNTLSYKGFEFSFMLYTRQGSTISSGYYRPALAGRYVEAAFTADYWTPANPANIYPRPTTDQERIDYPESYLYQDGSFTKVRYITLGYTVPKSKITPLKMESLRVYVTAFNPFLWTDFEAGDPEFYANSTRSSGGVNVPITNVNDQLIGNNLSDKSIVFGVSVGF